MTGTSANAYPDYLQEDPSLPGRAGSYWLASATHAPRPPLAEDIETEIVVIGAGLVGALTAYGLAMSGHDVVVLDRDTVLSDVTGHTTAKATVVHGEWLAAGLKAVGELDMGRHIAMNHLAIERIADLTSELGIACDLSRVDTIAYVESEDGLARLASTRGVLHAAALEPSDAAIEGLGVRATGALRIARELRFHPVRFGAGILAAAEGLGARIHEHSRVIDLDDRSRHVRVTTEHGTVTAQQAVVATHYPFHDHGVLFSRLFPYRTYVLGAYIAQELPDRNYIALDDGLTLRLHPADKGPLVIASGVHHKAGEGGDERERYHDLERMVRERFDVRDIPWHWSTQDNRTPDGLPFIGRSPGADRTWVATGFCGWGMSQAVVAAQVIEDLIAGHPHPLAELYSPSRFETGARFMKENANVAKELATGFFSEGSVDEIAPGEGLRIRRGIHRVAAYRDYEGVLHEISARCTHVGCGIEFNEAEKTWDCPCHGSRYAIDGRVIHGPTVRDLEAR